MISACNSLLWVHCWDLGRWDKLLMETEASSIAITKAYQSGLLNRAFTYSTVVCTDLILPMLFLNKTLFQHVNIWCMSTAFCEHIETYCFLTVTSAMKVQGIHCFSLVLPTRVPSFSVPVHHTLVFFQGCWNEKDMC